MKSNIQIEKKKKVNVPVPSADTLRMTPNAEDDFTDEEMKEIHSMTTANRSCKKCYGRGYIGTNVGTGKLVVCSCYDKNARKNAILVLAKRGAYKYTPKTAQEPKADEA